MEIIGWVFIIAVCCFLVFAGLTCYSKKILVAYFAIDRIRFWLRCFSWYHFDLGDLK